MANHKKTQNMNSAHIKSLWAMYLGPLRYEEFLGMVIPIIKILTTVSSWLCIRASTDAVLG